MILWLVFLVSFAAAVALSALLVRRVPAHRPVASILAGGFVADLVVGTRDSWGLAALLATSPHVGTDRVLYHVGTALQTAWPAAVAGLAWWTFGWRRGAAVPAALWVALNAALVLRYPFAEEAAQHALHVHEGVAVALAGVAIWRSWGRVVLRPPHHAARMLVAIELVIATVGPFRLDIFRDWALARFAYLLGFAALAAVTAVWLRRSAR